MTIYIDGHPYYPGRAANSVANVVIVGKETHTFRRNKAESDAKMQTLVRTNVRCCVTQLLRVAQPPFSDVFARALLAVLHLPHVISAFRPAAAADGKSAVIERVQALRHAHAPLAREAKKLLEKLQ